MSLWPMTSMFQIAPLFWTCPVVPPRPFFERYEVSGSSARLSSFDDVAVAPMADRDAMVASAARNTSRRLRIRRSSPVLMRLLTGEDRRATSWACPLRPSEDDYWVGPTGTREIVNRV